MSLSHQVHKLCPHALCDDLWLGEVRAAAGVCIEEPKTLLGVIRGV